MAKGIENADRKKKRSVLRASGKAFLDFLLSLAETSLLVLDRKELYWAAYGYREKTWSVDRIRQNLSRLRKGGYLEIRKLSDGRESIVFTNRTRMELIDRFAQKCEIDGYLHFVSFDIPEDMRCGRDAFRRSIKQIGFVEVQKSLWVCDRPVGKLVELAAAEYFVSDYVVYLIAKASNIDKTLHEKLGADKSDQ
jgi:DNA-binding transcriptional regulator PaaX